MPVQKVISAPSPASQSRGRTAMPALDRRVHYQAAEEGREGVQLANSVGEEITEEQAIAQMGGKNGAYTEVLSANSRLECEALFARNPEMEPREVMRSFYAAQARELDPTGRAIVAVHGDPDGGYHAHILLPGAEQDYYRTGANGRVQKLEGAYGQAQNAWNKVWVEGRPEVPIQDWDAHKRAKDLGNEIKELGFKAARKALVEGRKAAMKVASTLQDRYAIRESYAKREADLETRHHDLQLTRLEALYGARGQAGSLEHQVEAEREHYRHMAEVHRAEARQRGQEAYQARYTPADKREAFKHMGAEERKAVRAEALGREILVLKARFDAEKKVLDQDRSRLPEDRELAKAAQDRLCEAAVQGALFRHQAATLRDREEDVAKASGQSIKKLLVQNRLRAIPGQLLQNRLQRGLSRVPGASLGMRAQALQVRTELMTQRHALERQALVAEARSRGQEPSPKALANLDARQDKERKALSQSKAKLAVLTPTRQAVKTLKRSGTRAIAGSVAKVRQGLKKLQAAAKKGRNQEQPRSVEHLENGQNAVEGAALGAVAGMGKVALTAAIEGGKAALHQAQNAGQAIAVTAQAIATGIVNPLAGAKTASEGYAKVGAAAAKDAVQDAQSGGKAVTKDAIQAGRDSAQNALAGLGSVGFSAMPEELQASIKATKEATMAALKTAKSLLTLDLVGAGTSAGEGALGVAKEGGAMVRGALPMPLEKVADLAAKLPLVGVVAKGAKLAAELGAGGAKVAKTIEIDR